MRGRHILETGHWEELSLAPIDSVEGSHANWVAVVGMSAAHRGETDAAISAEARLRTLGQNAEAAGNLYAARENAVLEQEVAAIRLLSDGDNDAAVAAARNAADMEMQFLRMPSGPPKPMKPAGELYAGVLLAADRPEEAMEAFEAALQWVPLRTPSMRGLAQAAEESGDNKTANEMYMRIKNMPGAHQGD
jgi:tetratricopeptide (TPR) repeat protein